MFEFISFLLMRVFKFILPYSVVLHQRPLRTPVAFCLLSSVQVLPLDVTTSRDPYTWNYRYLDTLFTLSESLAEDGFEPLIIV